MKNTQLIKFSFIHASLTALYVLLVALFMNNASRIFGKEDGVFTGVAVLLLFVLSATVTGSLVLGKPILMYLDGAKKDAVKMFAYTVGWLFVWLVLFFALVLVVH